MIYDLDECDHSNIEVKLYPQQEGKDLFLHVLIGNTEVMQSPKPIQIVKSEKHKAME